jgi:hypothetical protein
VIDRDRAIFFFLSHVVSFFFFGVCSAKPRSTARKLSRMLGAHTATSAMMSAVSRCSTASVVACNTPLISINFAAADFCFLRAMAMLVNQPKPSCFANQCA